MVWTNVSFTSNAQILSWFEVTHNPHEWIAQQFDLSLSSKSVHVILASAIHAAYLVGIGLTPIFPVLPTTSEGLRTLTFGNLGPSALYLSLQVAKKKAMRCQSFAIDLPSANISAASTVTDEAGRGDGYLPVDGRGTLIRPEGLTVGAKRVGALGETEEVDSGGIPVQAKVFWVEMPEFSMALISQTSSLLKTSQKPQNNQLDG